MSQKTFEVVFSGKLVEGAAPQKVKANVAALFKVEVAKVERLFSGATVSIKKGLDEATAKKYQLALHRAGAITRVVNRAAQPAAPRAAAAKPAPKQRAAPPPQAAVKKGGSAADVGLQKSVVKQAPAGVGELAGTHIDVPGTVLVAHQEIPPPNIDTSGLSMDKAGAELIEHEVVPEPDFDLAGLTLGAEGEAIGKETPFVPLKVDVSAMSMDKPGVTLVEHEEVPEPKIDTSKLKLE